MLIEAILIEEQSRALAVPRYKENLAVLTTETVFTKEIPNQA